MKDKQQRPKDISETIANIWIYITLAAYTISLLCFGYMAALHGSDGQIAKSIGIFIGSILFCLVPPIILMSVAGFLAIFFFFRFTGVLICLATVVAWIDGVPNDLTVPVHYFWAILVFTTLNIWAAIKTDMPITLID